MPCTSVSSSTLIEAKPAFSTSRTWYVPGHWMRLVLQVAPCLVLTALPSFLQLQEDCSRLTSLIGSVVGTIGLAAQPELPPTERIAALAFLHLRSTLAAAMLPCALALTHSGVLQLWSLTCPEGQLDALYAGLPTPSLLTSVNLASHPDLCADAVAGGTELLKFGGALLATSQHSATVGIAVGAPQTHPSHSIVRPR